MNVVFLIGNGFDISLGLKKKYSNFYNHYINIESSSAVVNQFKSELKKNIKIGIWSDLEILLGQYIESISDAEQFSELTEDIKINLSKYLQNIEKYFSQSKPENYKNLFLDDLFQFENHLKGRDIIALRNFYHYISNHNFDCTILTFNYTNTIEQILGVTSSSNKHLNLNARSENISEYKILSKIYHLHGTTTADMVLGVNDESQIHHDELKKSEDVQSDLIKSICNASQRHGIELESQALIQNADIICIFGSSLGITDQLWWNLIAEQVLSRACLLVVFDYRKEYEELLSNRASIFRREIVKKIFGEIKDDVKDQIETKLITRFNANIFAKIQE